MPYQDGTGSWGYGPIGFGFNPYKERIRYSYPGYANCACGCGHHGWYKNWRYHVNTPYYVPFIEADPEEEKKYINQELEFIELQKVELTKRLNELHSNKK